MNAVDLLRFHRSLLSDKVRLESFRLAIEKCVKPGDVVLDLGSGTGVLAVFAARAGARCVYAIEASNIVGLARAIVRENGVEDRVVFLDQMSPRVEVPEAADVLVTETIGNFGFNEGILGWVEDARRRLLKPGATIVPQSIELHACLIEAPELYARICDWESSGCGVNLQSARAFAVNNLYPERIAPEWCLGAARSLGGVSLASMDSSKFDAETRFEVGRTGTLHGVCGWFSARLCDEVTISNAPGDPAHSWNQVFLPFSSTVDVQAGDVLRLRVACRGNGGEWRWQLEANPGMSSTAMTARGGVRFDQSTFFGAPESLGRLHRRAAGFAPALNVDGRTVRFLLGLMDGSRTLEELSRLAFAEFPERFSDSDDALEQVRTVSAEFGS